MAAIKRLASSALLVGGALLCGCAATSATGNAATQQAPRPLLAGSMPAGNSTVSGPVDTLMLHFNAPARLTEVTVEGPQGLMPMMVTAAGEIEHYSLPLPGLEPGSYIVRWKAIARGVQNAGSFSFTVKSP